MQAVKKRSEPAPSAKAREPAERKNKTLWLLYAALILCVLTALALLLSRPVGIWIADRQHEEAIAEYIAAVDRLSDEELAAIRARAIEYNRTYAAARPYIWSNPSGQWKEDYPTELDVPGTDVIGYLEIPAIDVRLPIYRYASDDNMSRGCAHSEGTSLPIGGTDGHYVLLSHRNLPAAVTFEHLDRLKVGDTFSVTVLKETATFQIENIRVVDPNCLEDYTDDKVEEGKELCTLVTCTPSGTNTHRLFVRGVRID